MVEISDIKDRRSLEAWLENQPREVSVWIAFRAAARVLPVWWDAVQTEDWAHERDLTALPVLRSLLITSVAALVRANVDANASAEAHVATSAAAHAAAFDDFHAHIAATAAAAAADSYSNATPASAAGAANASAAAASDASAFVWKAVKIDAKQATDGTLPEAVPLWPDRAGPLAKEWEDIKAQLSKSSDIPDWQFWLDWYDAQLAGRTLLPDPARTWDMLEKIAVIKPETWDAGPDTVNPLIREIWKLHRLRSEVAALQAEKDAFLATRASEVQRSHNQPPDGLVDDQPELARQITIVGNSLDEARDALEQDTPDKGWLRAIAEKLLSALTAVTKYCAKVADTAVISAAKVGGGAGGAAMVDYVANNGRLMQFAKDLLSYAAGV